MIHGRHSVIGIRKKIAFNTGSGVSVNLINEVFSESWCITMLIGENGTIKLRSKKIPITIELNHCYDYYEWGWASYYNINKIRINPTNWYSFALQASVVYFFDIIIQFKVIFCLSTSQVGLEEPPLNHRSVLLVYFKNLHNILRCERWTGSKLFYSIPAVS